MHICVYTHAHMSTYAHMCARTHKDTRRYITLPSDTKTSYISWYSTAICVSFPSRLTFVVADIIFFACPQPLAQCRCMLESTAPFCGIRTWCSPSLSEHTLTERCPASPKGSELSWCGLSGSAHTRRTRETRVQGHRATQDGAGPDCQVPGFPASTAGS